MISFNVEYSRHVEMAIKLIRWSNALRDPDIILLQEMDARGVKAVADSLGYAYVYFPATLHPVTGRDFGNAVVSRYPIEDARKLILPFLARGRRTMRAAVGATIRIGERRVRVYSVHLATFIGNGPNERRAQLAVGAGRRRQFPVVVMGGDFNSGTVPEMALRPRIHLADAPPGAYRKPVGDGPHSIEGNLRRRRHLLRAGARERRFERPQAGVGSHRLAGARHQQGPTLTFLRGAPF